MYMLLFVDSTAFLIEKAYPRSLFASPGPGKPCVLHISYLNTAD